MEIKDRISSIKQYFRTMQADSNVIYVSVAFPENWKIYDTVEKKYNVVIRPGNDVGEYYFFANMDDGFDVIFDAIEYNIKQMKDGIERAQLLNAKVKELKELFSNKAISVASLRTVTFAYETIIDDSIEPEIITIGDNDGKETEKKDNKTAKGGK